MTRQAERSIRLWLHAYPRGWRRHNGEALQGTLLDELAETGAQALTWPQRLDLIKGGLTARWRHVYTDTTRSEFAKSQGLVASAGLALITALATALALRVAVSGRGISTRWIVMPDRLIIGALLAIWPLGLALSCVRRTAQLALRLLVAGFSVTTIAYAMRAVTDSSLAPFSFVAAAIAVPAIVLWSLHRHLAAGQVIAPRWLLLAVLITPLVLLWPRMADPVFGTGSIIPETYFFGTLPIAAAWLLAALAMRKPSMVFAALISIVPLAFAAVGHAADLLTTFDDPRPEPAVSEVAVDAVLPLVAVAFIALTLGVTGLFVTSRRDRVNNQPAS